MEVAELLQSVRFVVGPKGRPTDAVIGIEVWEKLIDWMEDLEDTQIVRNGLTRLEAAGSHTAAGLLPWTEVDRSLETLEQTEKLDYVDRLG